MKKIVALFLTAIMLLSTVALLIPMSAGAIASNVLSVYISDSGNDNNNGLTTDAPKKTFNSALAAMKNKMSEDSAYTEGAFVLVGDVTLTEAPDFFIDADKRWDFPMTFTSVAGEKYAIKLCTTNVDDPGLRLGGETLFTNIKILDCSENPKNVTALRADGHKLTIGRSNDANDVVTYEAGVSERPLIVYGGLTAKAEHESIDVTINSGTYSNVHTGSGMYNQNVTGEVNFVINGGDFRNGVITLGSYFTSQKTFYDKGAQYIIYCKTDECTFGGAYNVTINGGTFSNVDFLVGVAGATLTGNLDTEGKVLKTQNCTFNGKVTLDINAGSFMSNCNIGTGASIVNSTNFPGIDVEMLHPTTQDSQRGAVSYNDGMVIDYSGLNNSVKNDFAALIPAADARYVIAHESNYTSVSNTQHKITCSCGCNREDLENHKWDDGKVTTFPTHTVGGEKTFTCTLCKVTRTEDVPADLDIHYYTVYERYNVEQHKKKCNDFAICGSEILEAHTWDEGTTEKRATHTEEGVIKFTCPCGETKTEVIPKSEQHETVNSIWQPHNDEQHKLACQCGETIRYGYHNFDDGKITTEPTTEAEGVKTYTCKSCGGTKTEAIAKLPTSEDDTDSSGCGSVIGYGVFIVPMLVGVAFIPSKGKVL